MDSRHSEDDNTYLQTSDDVYSESDTIATDGNTVGAASAYEVEDEVHEIDSVRIPPQSGTVPPLNFILKSPKGGAPWNESPVQASMQRLRKSVSDMLSTRMDSDEDDLTARIDSLKPRAIRPLLIPPEPLLCIKTALSLAIVFVTMVVVVSCNESRLNATIVSLFSLTSTTVLSSIAVLPSFRPVAVAMFHSLVVGANGLLAAAVLDPEVAPFPTVALTIVCLVFFRGSVVLACTVIAGQVLGFLLRLPCSTDVPADLVYGIVTSTTAAALVYFQYRIFEIRSRIGTSIDVLDDAHAIWLDEFKDELFHRLDPLPDLPRPSMSHAMQANIVLQLLDELIANTSDKHHLKILRLCQTRIAKDQQKATEKDEEAVLFINQWTGHESGRTTSSSSVDQSTHTHRINSGTVDRDLSQLTALMAQSISVSMASDGVSPGSSAYHSEAGDGDRAHADVESPDDFETAVNELLAGILKWPVDALQFEESLNGRVLQVILCASVDYFNLTETFNLPMATLQNLLTAMLGSYNRNPFHNAAHAALTVHSVFWLAANAQISSGLSDLDIIAVLFAAAIGDMAHTGVNNSFLTECEAFLAVRYNNQTPNEAHALARFFDLLTRPEFDAFCNIPAAQRKELRETIVALVLDTSSMHHMAIVSALTSRLDEGGLVDPLTKSDRMIVLRTMLRVAQLSTNLMPVSLYRMWTERAYEERLAMGDLQAHMGFERSAFSDRNAPDPEGCQETFFCYLAEPLFNAALQIIPELAQPMSFFHTNRSAFKSPEFLHSAIDRAREPRMTIYPHGKLPPRERLVQLCGREVGHEAEAEGAVDVPKLLRQATGVSNMSPVLEGSEDESELLTDDELVMSESSFESI
ncbi:3'5'-cyclic nucleotide phosphodiesterase [Carpediemonas membranifera]|uniref:3'5'-cyclic nucleotide phosphodiesterase n=1 Tax=Carpediemonas membranifera TaxID=201153 RepID=A0A8J6AY21_9EUKA|nr:3'5'-cyclic nucleotide phosphodiesterase [Carpediemonas membranifera]|eukprot:KAG9391233.1 3'5'-cyclic nucleotide phosphodiesterase [Carpediemonas membranifera]